MPFVCVSTVFKLPVLSNCIPNQLFFLSMVTLIYEYFKFGFEIPKKIKWYLVIFFCWCVSCLIHGLVCYEYNDTLRAATDMSARLRWFVATFPNFYNKFSDEITFMKYFKFYNGVKGIILTTLHMLLMLLYILHIYDRNFDAALSDVTKSCWVLAIAMEIHSFFELSYIWFGAEWAKSYLWAINHWIYETPIFGYWWPPRLTYGTYGNQLRSLCPEPSFFGLVSTVILPSLLLSFTKIKKNYKRIAFLSFWTILTVLVIMTKSRIANLVFVMFLFLSLLSIFIVRKTKFATCCVSIFWVSVLTFFGLTTSGIINVNPEHPYVFNIADENNCPQKYLEDNLQNLSERDARSNNTRYGTICAGLSIISKYPVFGVGSGLEARYVSDNLPDFAKNNSEINMWHNRKLENGQYAFTGGVSSALVSLMVGSGIFAGILWLLPIFIFALKFFATKGAYARQENYMFTLIMLMLCVVPALDSSRYCFLPSIPLALLFLYHRQMEQQQFITTNEVS